jgi:hypothetical protein
LATRSHEANTLTRLPGGFGGTSLVAGTGRPFPGKDAGSPRIDVRYGGDTSD